MTLTQAIERAISALEERIARYEAIKAIELRAAIRLDTEALAALREWKPEEKE